MSDVPTETPSDEDLAIGKRALLVAEIQVEIIRILLPLSQASRRRALAAVGVLNCEGATRAALLAMLEGMNDT